MYNFLYDNFPVVIILAVALIQFLMFIVLVRGNRQSKTNSGTIQITYNKEILDGFDVWLNMSISTIMTRFITERSAEAYKTENEMVIDSEFADDGIDYVSRSIALSIPVFYKNYMYAFYGQDVFSNYIYDKIRAIFMMYIKTEMEKRLSKKDKD